MVKFILRILIAVLFAISVVLTVVVSRALSDMESSPVIEETECKALAVTIDRIVVSEPKVNEPLVIGEPAEEPEPKITVKYVEINVIEQAENVIEQEEELTVVRNDISSGGRKLSGELQSFMQECCADYGVPYALALAMAEVETNFDPYAVSSTGDHGLMQINEINHEWLTEIGLDPLTQEGNIEAGIYMMAENLDAYGSMERALMAYNCGDAGAQKLWDAGTYETEYSRKVMAAYERWTEVLEG